MWPFPELRVMSIEEGLAPDRHYLCAIVFHKNVAMPGEPELRKKIESEFWTEKKFDIGRMGISAKRKTALFVIEPLEGGMTVRDALRPVFRMGAAGYMVDGFGDWIGEAQLDFEDIIEDIGDKIAKVPQKAPTFFEKIFEAFIIAVLVGAAIGTIKDK